MTSGRWFILRAVILLAVSSFHAYAQQPLSDREREEALRLLNPVCRVYDDERKRCVSARLPPARAARSG